MALARLYGPAPLVILVRFYVWLIRGTPLLVQILILFYVVANAFGIENRYLVGVLALSLFALAVPAAATATRALPAPGGGAVPAAEVQRANLAGLSDVFAVVVAGGAEIPD